MTTRIACTIPVGTSCTEHAARIARYLPSNYRVATPLVTQADEADDFVLVVGDDSAGWTATDYVIPRLASGLIAARILA